ncbi:adenine phosphoribosyltransferase [Arcobacter porcinus]|uniref:Adenine phosphoribosyltransferase n=1 Tax=Arcobacter porcinus TaxID=1935204 RepID=A0ABX2YDY0_9BACT|nr:adenine phosphoribosyltransferase [Arcobacter porcinus]OCL87417.1 Adenine phosphoribosyltransferase [Arcobacter porcinus]OCL93210.1 Adenine phosphoribosyltransferase [Arcobacter porcinus]
MKDNILTDEEKCFLINSIRSIEDFPKPGISFKDITTLLNNKDAFELLMSHLENRYKSYNLDFIAGIEARGFIFASALASRLNVGFVPVRKKGKLPSTTVCEKYELEYGFDEVEIHLDAFNNKKEARVLLIDDLVVSGGTAFASASLIKKVNANLVESCFILNFSILDGKEKLSKLAPVYTVLEI